MAVATWVTGARVRTLPAAVAPVAVGTAVAYNEDGAVWWKATLALVVALALQVGTNYANDYSDGIRGTDDERVGPVRLVASGFAAPASVKRAAYLAFAVAAVAGFVLAVTTAWWLLLVGAAAIAAGWFYTGGPKPYGYAGFGELSVFVFFGIVATAGTAFVQTEELTGLAIGAGIPMGLVACALLVVNNLRDLETDRSSGKRTLAVRLGDHRTRWFLHLLASLAAVAAMLVALSETALGAVLLVTAVPWMIRSGSRVERGATGRDLLPVLAGTAQYQLLLALMFAAVLVVSR